MAGSFISAHDESSAWWLDMNLYQIFVRSFADSNGDGIGDIAGITAHLHYLSELGINAIWLTPFYPSPQLDTGYDVANYCDVDPVYGTLKDFDTMVTQAHALGIRVFIDIVPNHSSSQHPWFQEALRAAPGSAARNRYLFFDGRHDGQRPPNQWLNWFGECAWTKVPHDRQWYLHMFADGQPDWNWRNPEIQQMFHQVLHFWLQRGVDGFRVDAPTTLIKPDEFTQNVAAEAPEDNQPEVFPIYRQWRQLLDGYGPRCMIAEEFPDTPEAGMENFVDNAKMNQLFCFDYQQGRWNADTYEKITSDWLEAAQRHGSTPVWVSSTHDLVRQASYLGFAHPGEKPEVIGPNDRQPDLMLGERRVRALTLLTLWLPGAICTYYGEELGLPDHTTLSEEEVHDKDNNRDGCRIPMPWQANAPHYGFSTAARTWLPQPDSYRHFAVDTASADPASTLNLYRTLFRLRRELGLAKGDIEYLPFDEENALLARNGRVYLAINFADEPIRMPSGRIIAQSLSSITAHDRLLPGNSAVWLWHD